MAEQAGGLNRDARWPLVLLGLVGCVVVWSWIGATDRVTWWLESFPFFLALPVLLLSFKKMALTRLVYVLIAVHASILLVGAHYTYEHVPLFDWIKAHFHLLRNDYDKLGHLAQGFVPAMIAREVLIRRKVVAGRGWLFFLVLCVCMAISASYELLEWAVAVAEGSGADAFLATQGDPWDTQSDMLCAMIGALVAQMSMSGLLDREIEHAEAKG